MEALLGVPTSLESFGRDGGPILVLVGSPDFIRLGFPAIGAGLGGFESLIEAALFEVEED